MAIHCLWDPIWAGLYFSHITHFWESIQMVCHTFLANVDTAIERIHVATDSLEEKVQALEAMQAEIEGQKKSLHALETELKDAIAAELSALKAAA